MSGIHLKLAAWIESGIAAG